MLDILKIDRLKQIELEVKQIFDVSFQIYRQNFIGICVYLLVLMAIAWVVTFSFTFLPAFHVGDWGQVAFDSDLFEIFIMSLIMGTSVLVFTPMAKTFFLHKRFNRQEYFSGYKNLLKYLVTLVVQFCVTLPLLILLIAVVVFADLLGLFFSILLTLLLLAGTVYVMLLFIFSVHSVAFHDTPGVWGIEPLRRSSYMIKGRMIKTFLIIAICGALTFLLMEIFSFVLMLLGIRGTARYFIEDLLVVHFSSYILLTVASWYLNRHYTLMFRIYPTGSGKRKRKRKRKRKERL